MAFGPNGAVLTGASGEAGRPAYSDEPPRRLRRILLGVFLCGPVASLSVALLGFAGLLLLALTGMTVDLDSSAAAGPFAEGMTAAFGAAALNWIAFFITVPAAWLALGFSLGLFPRRGILRPGPYYRWGAIWGGALVCLFTVPIAWLASAGPAAQTSPDAAIGGLVAGVFTGGLAGLACGGLFRLIVRPAEQVAQSAVEVF